MNTTIATPRQRTHVPTEQEIRRWMRAPAIMVNIAAPMGEALALMREHAIRRLPVVIDTGALRGIITLGDIRSAEVLRAAGLEPVDIADALHRIKVYDITESDMFAALVQRCADRPA